MSGVQKWFAEDSGWIIESLDIDYINISIYNSLARQSYMQLPEELRNSRKSLVNSSINIKNKYNECFHWCDIRHFNPMKKVLN